jgi:hypothetical protein
MRILNLQGKTYKLADFDEKLAGELLAWAKTKLADPLAEIKDIIKDFPPWLQEVLVKDAMAAKRTPKSIDHPEVSALLKTPEGLERVMLAMFTKYQPDLKADDVWAIHHSAVKEFGEEYIQKLPTE